MNVGTRYETLCVCVCVLVHIVKHCVSLETVCVCVCVCHNVYQDGSRSNMMAMLMSVVLSAVVPHRTFRAKSARVVFRNYLPVLVANRVVNCEFNGHLSRIISLLKQDDVFMVCSLRSNSAFVCTDLGSTHVIEATLIDRGSDALTDMMEWHTSEYPHVDLQMA